MIRRLYYALSDFWFGMISILNFNNNGYTYGDTPTFAFLDRIERESKRSTTLGASLMVVLSKPEEQESVIAQYHLRSMTDPKAKDEYVPVLLWYRDILLSPSLEISKMRDTSRNAYLRRAVLREMIRLINADKWPEPTLDGVREWIEQWDKVLSLVEKEEE
jgi:hypothetical protein